MIHKTLEAKATVTDKGEFTALAATYALDRVGDRIIKGAFEKTIAAWQASQKQVPVHWDHEGAAASVIGSVDPASMQETDEGLYVKGKLDLGDSETAREAWRSMKDNRVSLSFGYLATRETKAEDGVNELLEIDLFEVSIVPAPANPGTRLLSLKAVDRDDGTTVVVAETVAEESVEETPSAEELRKHTFDLALELAGGATKAHEGDDAGLAALEEALKDRRVQLAIWQALKSIAETGETPPPDDGEPETPETSETSAVEDGKDEEPEKAKSTPQDPLRKRTFDLALGISNGGMRVPTHLPEPEPEPEPLNEAELRRQSLQAALAIARGD